MNHNTVLILSMLFTTIPVAVLFNMLIERDRVTAVEPWLSVAGPMADVLHSTMSDVADVPAGSSASKPSTPDDPDGLFILTGPDGRAETTASGVRFILSQHTTDAYRLPWSAIYARINDLTDWAIEAVPADGPSTDDNDHDPFDARDLVHVLDRVVSPVTVEYLDGDGFVRVTAYAVERNHYNDSVDLFDANDDHIQTLSGYAQVELVGPVTVLDAPDEVKAYYCNGDLLCADHGAPFDIGVSDGAVSPIFDGLDAVEYCSHWNGRDGGHSFCGQCGTHFEPAGHPDAPFAGPFVFCDNCSTRSVYVDGIGYRWIGFACDGFEDTPAHWNVRVTLDGDAVNTTTWSKVTTTPVYPFGWSSRLSPVPSGVVDAVQDASGRRFSASWGFVCYLDDNPSAGTVLILSESAGTAWEYAVDFDPFVHALEDALDGVTDEDEADGIRSDHQASLQMIRVRLSDAVEVTRKP